MKKILVMAMAIGTLGFASCSDDNDEDKLSCDQLFQIYVDAKAAYAVDSDNNELCQEYRAALQDYLDEDCPGPEDRDQYEAELDALNCDDV
jgi:hypothetical protein